MWLVAKGDSLKQHCNGYYYGKEPNRTFHETKHSKAVKARETKRALEAANAPVPQGPAAPIFINVCEFGVNMVIFCIVCHTDADAST